jgi:hypothetical protein
VSGGGSDQEAMRKAGAQFEIRSFECAIGVEQPGNGIAGLALCAPSIIQFNVYFNRTFKTSLTFEFLRLCACIELERLRARARARADVPRGRGLRRRTRYRAVDACMQIACNQNRKSMHAAVDGSCARVVAAV